MRLSIPACGICFIGCAATRAGSLLEEPEELDRLAHRYTADTETLLSPIRLPVRRRISVR